MKKVLIVILICMASVAGAAGVITPHWSGAIIDNLVVKESPWVDVRAYGALGDGTTDDGPAVLAAFNAIKAAGGGTLLVPKGIYKINTKITLDKMPQFNVVGVGGMNTPIGSSTDLLNVSCFLNGTGGGVMFQIDGTVAVGGVITSHINWVNVSFDNRANANNVAFHLTSAYDRMRWAGCAFFGGLSAFTFSTTTTVFNAMWERCFFSTITKAFDLPDGTTDALNMVWKDNIFRSCGYAVYALRGNSFYFKNNLVEACTTDGYYLTQIAYIHIDGDHFEQNAQRDVFVDNVGSYTTKVLTMRGVTHTKWAAGGQTVCVLVYDSLVMFFSGNSNAVTTGGADYQIIAPGGRYVTFVANSLVNGYSVTGGAKEYKQILYDNNVSYTPTWVSDSNPQPNIGNGTLEGHYTRIGNQVTANIFLKAGSTTTFGTGKYYFSLPTTTDNTYSVGVAHVFDYGVQEYVGVTRAERLDTRVYVALDNNGTVNPTNPFTLANTDEINISHTYHE